MINHLSLISSIEQKTLEIWPGTAIAVQNWAGIQNIEIDATYRGRKLSYSLLYYLSKWCLDHGINNMFLQVVADNTPAIALYENTGFKPLYKYHYLSQA